MLFRSIIDFDSALNVESDTLFLTANNFKYPKKSSRISQAKKTTAKSTVTTKEVTTTAAVTEQTTTATKQTAKPATASTTKTATAANGNGGVWIVKSGDTLSHIAVRTKTTITHLCKVNGITRNKIIRIGQKIKY